MTYFDADNIPYNMVEPYDWINEDVYDDYPQEVYEPTPDDPYFWSDEDWFNYMFNINV